MTHSQPSRREERSPRREAQNSISSTKLMIVGLAFVTLGCTPRVSCEVLAYQGYAAWAWSVLPSSALCELAERTVYAINTLGTFILEAGHAEQ